MEINTKGRHHVGSDCYPVTIVKVIGKGRSVLVRKENFVAAEGHDYFGEQKWEIIPNPQGRVSKATWSEKRGRYQINGSESVFFDGWHARQDPSF